jgi:plasmid maintenance system antidote protein VapI
MTPEELSRFFAERPSLSKRGVAREAGISLSLLNYILTGQRNLTEEVSQSLKTVLKKYGY